ncbi:ABC transporter permease [Pelagibacterium sp. 26DY04]|uniref:ABC transporter permease n=1 Tax=unclassified Pelagibacterium TaxID=2623280 RepID=UPI002815231F|nr:MULTISPECIES: ABC transporter permease [unclassified Pelagibacterium]WMT85270.1 ABC transporter permease [Pelagibacterium sp. 26DY04]WMT90423.1 ABC transporter permease [Pelagibacterium sp. H642]
MSNDIAITKTETAEERFLRLVTNGWIFLLLLGLVAFFLILRPAQFGSAYNVQQLAINAAILLVLAVGQTYVIMTSGIDLSVGSVLVFSSVVSAKLMLMLSGADGTTYGTTDAGWDVIAIGTLAALAVGAAWGALNGVLVAIAKIPPLIVTLGSMGMALGGAQILSGGVDVRAMPELLVTQIGSGRLLGIPMLVLIAAAVVIVAGIVLHLTRFGMHVFAVGSNAEASRRNGIPTTRRLIEVYAISGLMAGIAAVMSNARFSTTTINGHTMDNLATISAVVLGGTSLFGGRGSVFGTVVGVFIPIILLNGFVILGIPPFWQTVAMGAVLILAVWIDQLKRRLRKRG